MIEEKINKLLKDIEEKNGCISPYNNESSLEDDIEAIIKEYCDGYFDYSVCSDTFFRFSWLYYWSYLICL